MTSEGNNPTKIDGPSLESRWERGLVVISIPHGAAFGAFYGKYDFSSNGGKTDFLFLTAMMLLLPLTTAWLFRVHDLLRNVFLRQGCMGRKLKNRHSIHYYCVGFSPLLLFILMVLEPNKDNKVIIIGIIWVLFSWAICATWFSNLIYLKAGKALGIEVDD